MRLIGIDCAVNPKDIGIAEAVIEGNFVRAKRIIVGAPDPVKQLLEIVNDGGPVLLAFDSPLGWPSSLGEVLAAHRAGQLIDVSPNQLFRRETDRFVRSLIGKQPLEVGADRIARTAVASLKLLNAVTARLGEKLPLVWSSRAIGSRGCIEVYPAATLEALGFSSRGYKGKKPHHLDAREALVEKLGGQLILSDSAATMARATDHALDAAICCLAAADFVRRLCLSPPDESLARKEGWIWVRTPVATQEPGET